MKYLICIAGPTGIGKSALALELASTFSCPILNADSRQIYQEINIANAKPSLADMERIPHHLIGHVSIYEAYDVGRYEQEALQHLSKIFLTHSICILCGGTGLYIKALLEGMDEFPDVSPESVFALQSEFENYGIDALQKRLRETDPSYFNIVDINNPHRLIRALSVIETSGKPYSSFLSNKKVVRPFTSIGILLEMEREELYDRINQRVLSMLERGLRSEAKKLYPHQKLRSLNTVGLKEFFMHFAGKITQEEAIQKIQQHSRQYAKRQITWFKKHGSWTTFHPTDAEKILKMLETSYNLTC